MAKMSFPNTVNYSGKVYPARTVFTVKDSDVDELRRAGGWVVETKTKQTPKNGTKKD